MSAQEFGTELARPSQGERDSALEVLRDGVGSGRLSHDTFVRRMELVLTARSRAELAEVIGDLRTYGPVSRLLLRTVAKVSALNVRLRQTWHAEQLTRLRLPDPGVGRLLIGRMTGAGLRLGDATVSRRHAELRFEGDTWVLYDLGSSNGTFVNDRRVAGGTAVRPGDRLRFGRLAFHLSAD
ncbi:FHA domain-containing protein [Kitasatospora sp. NPDC059795]|uniref:FHA domain-containing protein n=1 Tax=Kitasatospora sp. NPDC059795 TaxID=3346949 RepID=UPI00364E6DC0